MDLVSLESLQHLVSSIALNDSSLALIALLGGMAAGWIFTNWREQQVRTKRAKIDRH
ncbi:MAG TPA: hypothetical protein VHB68_10365 [Steroidobacteraceae bacterium]|nr:hypothetical protein [Steroidobacteraceae bacterium]